MANAKHDENHVPTMTGVLNSDGKTPINILITESNHRLNVSEGISGTDNGPTNAKHDENHVPTLIAVSSVDGVTPVVVYADSNGKLLVTKS
jgi:hypothetical protein